MQREYNKNGKEEGPKYAQLSAWLLLLSYLLYFCTAEEEFSLLMSVTNSGIEDVDFDSCKCVYGLCLGHEQTYFMCSTTSLLTCIWVSYLKFNVVTGMLLEKVCFIIQGLFATLLFPFSESYTISIWQLVRIILFSFNLMQADWKILLLFTVTFPV